MQQACILFLPILVGIICGYLVGDPSCTSDMYIMSVRVLPIVMFVKAFLYSIVSSLFAPLIALKMKSAVSSRIYATVSVIMSL